MRIAVYGASGHQGKLIVAELARRGLQIVAVGRDRERLRAAAGDAEVRVAGLDDADRLAAAFRGCTVVINCAGPFTLSGSAVVRAALAAGCHYADTSGEQAQIKQTFDLFGAEAGRAGVTVVPAATDGGVPGDLIAHLLADRLGPLEEIVTAHLIAGSGRLSRGSLRSLLETAETLWSGGLGYEDGAWHPTAAARRTTMRFPGGSSEVPVVRFALQEVVTVPRHVDVRRVEGVADAALAARFAIPIDPAAIESLPEGPAAESREAQEFTIVIDAVARDGRSARGVVRGRDTYGTTARVAVEAASRLAADGAKPGVLAPSQAFDPAAFLDALAPYGLTWDLTVDG
ncbi:saccharopine dehydrogenase NADP-binding domain-containing protein [Actinomadura sp. DC4]|uniref:saccharopine dehydrogenase family protein n=1 Tax=Actinomadura sp. DC4 TaxID=3055069 RepID=UPI0025B276E3|nr:saccharopine dehydrogenase NADP-binding domain-containing protein [Actinomadura sp. DC4]MDN3355220.1 saccharopine dehydrogenase NADP-binding domain-containing protein [Actinomadura sp. DC4]